MSDQEDTDPAPAETPPTLAVAEVPPPSAGTSSALSQTTFTSISLRDSIIELLLLLSSRLLTESGQFITAVQTGFIWTESGQQSLLSFMPVSIMPPRLQYSSGSGLGPNISVNLLRPATPSIQQSPTDIMSPRPVSLISNPHFQSAISTSLLQQSTQISIPEERLTFIPVRPFQPCHLQSAHVIRHLVRATSPGTVTIHRGQNHRTISFLQPTSFNRLTRPAFPPNNQVRQPTSVRPVRPTLAQEINPATRRPVPQMLPIASLQTIHEEQQIDSFSNNQTEPHQTNVNLTSRAGNPVPDPNCHCQIQGTSSEQQSSTGGLQLLSRNDGPICVTVRLPRNFNQGTTNEQPQQIHVHVISQTTYTVSSHRIQGTSTTFEQQASAGGIQLSIGRRPPNRVTLKPPHQLNQGTTNGATVGTAQNNRAAGPSLSSVISHTGELSNSSLNNQRQSVIMSAVGSVVTRVDIDMGARIPASEGLNNTGSQNSEDRPGTSREEGASCEEEPPCKRRRTGSFGGTDKSRE